MVPDTCCNGEIVIPVRTNSGSLKVFAGAEMGGQNEGEIECWETYILEGIYRTLNRRPRESD